jgi:hypothetical protein
VQSLASRISCRGSTCSRRRRGTPFRQEENKGPFFLLSAPCSAAVTRNTHDESFAKPGSGPLQKHELKDDCRILLVQVAVQRAWARKRHFFRHLYIKCIILPRQARDKHRENSKKVPFSQARLLLWWAGAAAEKAGLGRACLWPHAHQLGQDAERSALRAAPAQGAFSAI